MQVAVVTGASMGLGEEFARQLAARGEHLALVARSEDRMRALASELEARHGIRAMVMPCDLSRSGAAADLARRLDQEGLEPKWLINNAGFGTLGPLAEMPPDRVHDMVMVNVLALTDLSCLLLPRMRALPDARIINVASTAAFQPIPRMAEYAASKAYVLSLSEAVHEECRGSSVRVLCLCPGPTTTNFGMNARMTEESFKRQKRQSPELVVRKALKASDAGRAVCLTQQRVLVNLSRFVPRVVTRRIAGWVVKAFE